MFREITNLLQKSSMKSSLCHITELDRANAQLRFPQFKLVLIKIKSTQTFLGLGFYLGAIFSVRMLQIISIFFNTFLLQGTHTGASCRRPSL